ncbi:plasmid replication protein, CyRepA1 family [Mesorhizobium ciceri]|uniref:plasmid replication protein, CyRepA1 family n=1 Tax=Mesorhizobium TaxID=68287 RepID=UPI00047AB61B|nr:plasmid replication protein, CyRepA1 family [Mesorhizobium ciceri]
MNGFTTKPLRLSINKRLINKDELGDTLARAEGFEPSQVTVSELIASIRNGYAYCAELNGRRKADNFTATDVLSVDIDGGLTISEALNHPFVQKNASFIYTTCSHTPEEHRFRVVFILQDTLLDANEVRAATRSLALKLNGDPKAVDPARMFYGNTEAQVTEIGMTLPSMLVDELIDQTAAAGRKDTSLGLVGTGRSAIQLPPDQVVRTAQGIDVLLASTGAKTEVHCPIHNDRNPSAFVVENASKSNKGVHCSACGVTYWQGYPEPYDFDAFDKAAKMAFQDCSSPSVNSAVEKFKDAKISFRDEKYISPIGIEDGTTFIKSPKGTGKTKLLAQIVGSTRGRVLLIGHRRALIDSMCSAMGLACYLHDDQVDEPQSKRRERYGICLDSILKMVEERPYDVVVIDESEQVLAHLLSQTLAEKRPHIVHALICILARAKRVIAADADLSWTSFNFIKEWAERRNGPAASQVIINQYRSQKGKLHVFASETHLVGDFRAAIKQGKRCYFTSNSREKIKDIAAQIGEECPEIACLVVTSDETADKNPAAIAFIKNPSVEARKYHAVLASPSIGTGVDITFPDDEQFYDSVYGLFVPQVLTHFECDQQLGRVRHPKQVKVHVSPATYAFETDLSVVKRDAQNAHVFNSACHGWTLDFIPTPIRRPDPLADVAAAIISLQWASKNQLWRNFLHYKVQQGWEIEHVDPHEEIAHLGLGMLSEGKERRARYNLNRLMQAEPLSEADFQRIDRRFRNYEFTNDSERASYERSAIERFYDQTISAELIMLDNRGRFRARVTNFEMMVDRTTAETLSGGIYEPERRNQAAMLILNPNARRILLMETLSTTPFYQDFAFTPEIIFGKADLTRFVDWVKANRIAIQQQFNIAVHKGLDKIRLASFGLSWT